MEFSGLTWTGPYSLLDAKDGRPSFEDLSANVAGVYIWTVEIGGCFFPINVGRSGDVRGRIAEHRKGLLSGRDYVYDPALLRVGTLRVVHKASIERPLPPTLRAKVAREYGELISFFVLELPGADVELLKAAEAEITREIEGVPEACKVFDPSKHDHGPPVPDQEKVPIFAKMPHPIAGVPSVLWV